MNSNRRDFIKQLGLGTVGMAVFSGLPVFAGAPKDLFFKISLAEWSLHKALFAREITNLDFPGIAAKKYGIHAVEYVNQFFKDKAKDATYLKELQKRAKDNGVVNVLIMIDGEGELAGTDDA
ncbi:MAG TPA: twin-arginine translocation signal domain-containing protein, partial [Sphingobacteriaceae bacterium]